MLTYFLVALSVAGTDAAWTFYMRSVARQQPTAAGVASAAIHVAGGYVVLSYTADPWAMLAAAVGGFVGTWVTVKLGRGHVAPAAT